MPKENGQEVEMHDITDPNTMKKPLDPQTLYRSLTTYGEICDKIAECEDIIYGINEVPAEQIISEGFSDRRAYLEAKKRELIFLEQQMMHGPFRAVYESTRRAAGKIKPSPLETVVEDKTEHDKIEVGDSWEEVHENLRVPLPYKD